MKKIRVLLASIGLLLLGGCASNPLKETTYFGITLLTKTWMNLLTVLFLVLLGLFLWGGAALLRRIAVNTAARKRPWQKD